MNKKLKDIAEIQYGLYQKSTDKGDVLYLQVKDFQDNKYIDNGTKHYINLEEKNQKHILKQGDIIMAAKGAKFFAWCYTSEIGVAVASSTFFVIRLTDNSVLSEYITVILNHPKTEKYFNAHSVGSNIRTLKKNVLLDFGITVLPIHEQQKLIAFMQTWEKEKEITYSLVEKKERLYQQYFQLKIGN